MELKETTKNIELKEATSKIGLDKTKISNFTITKIDLQKLKEVQQEKGKYKVTIDENKESAFFGISYLKIIDNDIFSDLIVGKNNFQPNNNAFYNEITINVSNLYGNNLKNITLETLKEELLKIQEYLYSKYGIVCDLYSAPASFSMMEINCNILLDAEFGSYKRVFDLCMFNLPDRLKPVITEFKSIERKKNTVYSDTFIRKNNLMAIELYNKSKQVKNKYNIDLEENNDKLLRIEIKLLNKQKIKEAFGTNKISEFSTSTIQTYYYQQFQKLFVAPYKNWLKNSQKKLKEIISIYKSEHRNTWQKKSLTYLLNYELKYQVPLMLDIEQFIKVALSQENEKKNGHSKRLCEKISEVSKDFFIFTNHDTKKMDEIIKKVSICHENAL